MDLADHSKMNKLTVVLLALIAFVLSAYWAGNTSRPIKPQDVIDTLEVINDHFHGVNKQYPTGDPASVTGGGAGAFGTYTEIIPINTIALPFDIHRVEFASASAADEYSVQITCPALGADSVAATFPTVKPLGASAAAPHAIVCPRLPANARVNVAIKSKSGGDALTFWVEYHTY